MDSFMGMDTCLNSNTLYRSISDVVSNHWDPLGISDSVNSRNHYDYYIPVIYNWALVANNKEDLIQELGKLACNQLGVATNHHNDRRAADLIIAIRDFHINNLSNQPHLDSELVAL